MVKGRMRKEGKIKEEIKGERERGQQVGKSTEAQHDRSEVLETSVEGQEKGLIHNFQVFTV